MRFLNRYLLNCYLFLGRLANASFMRWRTLPMLVPLLILVANGRSCLMKRSFTISSTVRRGSCSAILTTTMASSVALRHSAIWAKYS